MFHLLILHRYLILSTSKPRCWEIKEMLGANKPITSKVLPIDKYNAFTPTLWINTLSTNRNQPASQYSMYWVFLKKKPSSLLAGQLMFSTQTVILTRRLTKVSLGGPSTQSLAWKNPGIQCDLKSVFHWPEFVNLKQEPQNTYCYQSAH